MREPVTLSLCLAVAAGGAFGAVLRFLVTNAVSRYISHQIFPLDTIVVNMLGGLVLGALLEMMAIRWNLPPEARAFLIFGVIGGFTTFARFAVDIVAMLERGELTKTILYIFISICATILSAYGAMRLVRGIYQPE
jgi:CrcB protein